MGLLVVAYPEVSDKDFNWIQDHRKKHDRYYSIINPHFTFVFPVHDLKEKEFVDHIKKASEQFTRFNFMLKSAVTVKDSFSDYWDVFLIPDEGNSNIIKMHNTLYTGILITQLRVDIPYFPHMGIGNDIDPYYSYNMANEINNADIAVKGGINNLSVVTYDGKTAENIEDIELKQKLF